MRNRKRDKAQRELLFAPRPEVKLAKGAIQEAVAGLAAMIVKVMAETDRTPQLGGRDE